MQQRKVQCTEVQRAYCRAHISLQAAIFNNYVTSYKVLKGWKWSINNIQEVRQTWLIYIVLLALEGGCACNISWILRLWRRKTQHKSLFILLSIDSFFKSLLENFAIIFGGIMTPPLVITCHFLFFCGTKHNASEGSMIGGWKLCLYGVVSLSPRTVQGLQRRT